jgi:hypothetical protein
LPYAAAATLLGLVWLFTNPEFWKRSDRSAAAYVVFMGASLAVALLLRARIRSASGWRVWALAVLVALIGHYLVNWGLAAADALQEGTIRTFPGEPWLDAALKRFVILPTVFLVMTALLLPIYAIVGAGYVYVLRSIDRATAPTPEPPASAARTPAPATPPRQGQERTLASAAREASAVVIAKAETPFIVHGEKAIAKGPPYAWNILRFRNVEVLKGDPALPAVGEVLTVSLYDDLRLAFHRAYHEQGFTGHPALDPADAPYPTTVKRIDREARGGVILFLVPCAKTRRGGHEGFCFVHPQSFESLAKLDEVKRALGLASGLP